MDEYLTTIDVYGNGSVVIDVSRYCYQGHYYVKGVRTVVRTGKTKVAFNMPENVAMELVKAISQKCNKVAVA